MLEKGERDNAYFQVLVERNQTSHSNFGMFMIE